MAEEEHYNITDFTTKTTDKNNDDDFLLIIGDIIFDVGLNKFYLAEHNLRMTNSADLKTQQI